MIKKMKKKLLHYMVLATWFLLIQHGSVLWAQVKVKVVPVVNLSEGFPQTYVGTVEPLQSLTIQSKVSGRIAGIKVDENQRVKKGEVLLSLENAVTKLQMELSELQVSLSENTLKEAREALEDTRQRLSEEQQMYDRGTSTRQRLDSLKLQKTRNQINKESSHLRLLVARKELEIRKESYADTFVLSPLSGIVTQRFHEPGEVVGSGTALLEVIDIDQVWIECGITEEEIGSVKKGQTVDFRVPAFPGKKFKGIIEKLAWKADPQTRRFSFSVLAENPGRQLRGGMTAQVQLLPFSKVMTAVPPGAVRNDSGIHYVLVPKANRLEKREVQLLGNSKGLIKITGALKKGELVVVSPARNLKPGQKVEF